MTKKIKKTKIKNGVHTRKEVSGKDRHERMEKAYRDWKLGKENSLSKLADKYHLHVPDISRYITTQFELAKLKKQI